MIGVVVVTHGKIGIELVNAAKRIIPEAKHLVGVEVQADSAQTMVRKEIQDAIGDVEGNEGTLILTDMFGGTPSNLCLPFLNRPNTEVISGVNLPMLIKLASMKKAMSFRDVVEFIQSYGRRNIVVATDVLQGDVDDA